MPTNQLQSLNANLHKHILQAHPEEAQKWLMKQAKNLKISRSELFRDKNRVTVKLEMGKMYLFRYDPKGKKDLPYYDTYPLVIPIEPYGNAFLGLNLHYLPPSLRSVLLGKLMDTMTNTRYDATTKFKLSYDILASTKRYSEFTPCIKRYLLGHVVSKFVRIEAEEWHAAIALPYQSFKGASSSSVWKESVNKI